MIFLNDSPFERVQDMPCCRYGEIYYYLMSVIYFISNKNCGSVLELNISVSNKNIFVLQISSQLFTVGIAQHCIQLVFIFVHSHLIRSVII